VENKVRTPNDPWRFFDAYAYRAVRRSRASGWLQARPVDHAVTLDIRIRVKFSSQVNIADIDAGSMTGADALGRVGPAWGRPF